MELIQSFFSLFRNARHIWYTIGKIGYLAQLICTLIGILITAVTVIIAWRIYQKAGKDGWACLIPFYRDYVLYEIAFGNGLWFLIQFVPVARFVFNIMLNVRLAKVFGKGTGFGIGLWLLPLIFRAILALDDSVVYRGPIPL